MSKKSAKWRVGWSLVVVLTLLLSLPGSLVLPGKVAASLEAATVFLDPPSQPVEVGGKTTVEIRVASVNHLYGAEVHLAFDNTLLRVVDADPIMDGDQITPSTDFFPFAPEQYYEVPGNGRKYYYAYSEATGGYFIAQAEANNAAGTISYAFILLDPAPGVSVGPEGKTLATITFERIGEGTANIDFVNPLPDEPPVKLADVAGNPIHISPGNIHGAVILQKGVPAITLTPTSGPVGTLITVTGTGFDPGSSVDVTFDGDIVVSTITAPDGSFTADFTVPDVPVGDYTVTATDAAGNAASAIFTVPPLPPTTVEVNLGETITIAPGGTVSTIPLDIKGIPDLGPDNGVGGFTFKLSWDATIIHVDDVTAETIGGFSIVPGVPDNVEGTVSIAGFTAGTLLREDVTVATLNISAQGAAGTSTSIDVTIIDLGDKDGITIAASPVNGPVRIIAGVAETGISQDVDDDAIVVIPVKVIRVKDPITGEPVNIPGGLGVYEAKVTSHPADGIEILDVRGTDYFPDVVFNPATGEFTAFHAPSPAQPDNTVVAKVVPRLTGSAMDSYTLTIAFEVIGAAGEVLNVPEEEPNSLIFLRGDATGDGTVNIFDAMFIAQKVVGIRGLDTVNALNAASVKHDESGDAINIFDAMYIAQYVVGIRDVNYNRVLGD